MLNRLLHLLALALGVAVLTGCAKKEPPPMDMRAVMEFSERVAKDASPEMGASTDSATYTRYMTEAVENQRFTVQIE